MSTPICRTEAIIAYTDQTIEIEDLETFLSTNTSFTLVYNIIFLVGGGGSVTGIGAGCGVV